jgi:phytoene dehydrogenase-like protein
MPTNSYDLIVVGDDLAGLICAALCAKRGMRTLVLGHDDRPARYALGPHKLPVEALVWAGRGGAAADRVIKELHLEHDLRRRLRDARVTAQLIGPDARIDLAGDAQLLARELERELAGGAEAMRAAWDQATEVARAADPMFAHGNAFPGVGFFERREVAKQAERAAELAQAWADGLASLDPRAAALLRLPAAVGARAVDPAPLAVARAIDMWRAGAPGLRGDGDGLRELLIEKLEHASGERRAARVAELSVGWGKVSSVRLENGEELGAGQVVAALPAAELVPLFGKKPPKRVVELAAQIAIAGWRYTLNLVVDGSGVPEGMAQTVLALADADAPLVGANAFAIHLGEPDDAGRVVVTASATLAAPPDGSGGDAPAPAKIAALRADLVRALDDTMPFLAEHLVVAHSPHQDVAPEVPGGRGGHEPSRSLPVAMRPLWRPIGAPLEDSAGCAIAPYTTGLKNLTIASTQVLPHLGLEGDLTAGWSAAKIVCALAGKKKDYLRDEILGATGS